MGHIFISYSHKDNSYAHALADNLQNMGFNVWIDARLDYGSQWPHEIQKQLDSCDAFILIMTPNSFASDWVQSELQRAKRKLKPIFPMMLVGDEPWLSIESTQFYDVRGEILPDNRFYSALKGVIPSSQTASTLKYSKKTASTKPKKGSGLVIALIGAVVTVVVAYGIFLAGTWIQKRVEASSILISPSPVAPIFEPAFLKTLIVTPNPIVTSVFPTAADNVSSPGGEMALVPAGEFIMGRNAIDELTDCQKFNSECNLAWFTDEEPVHKVYLDDFYIDIYEVTNALYEACENEGVCDPPQSSNSSTQIKYYGNPEFDNYPAIYLNWSQAKTYCEWRGARLPTEAEWEKAARGTDGRNYPWGEDVDETFANFGWNVGDITAVGSYENGKSPYGVYDMAGNVWEWVSSLHESYPYIANDGRESLNANGPRIVRGGSWGYEGDNSVSASYRFAYNPTDTNLDLGFRCARDEAP